jgi:hypothetical protein
MSLRARCIDGRKPNSEKGLITKSGPSFPGGGIGIHLAVIAGINEVTKRKDWNPKRELDYLVKLEDGLEKCGCHTLENCAHWKSFINNPILYNISEGQRDIIRPFYEQSKDLRPDELIGQHSEQFLLRVISNGHTVRHQDKDGNQAFVYDDTASRKHINSIINKRVLNGRKPPDTHMFFKHIYEHLALTTQRVTNGLDHLQKGLRIYTVTIDDSGQLTHIQLSRTILSHAR